jgi:GT2 family glycosyltransferase/glycosyltransferase involved in cell wall biosynthesis
MTGLLSRLLVKRRASCNEEREADVSPTVLVFRSAELERVRRSIQHVRERFPDHEIALALSDTEKDYFGGWPGVNRFHYYRAHQGVVKGGLDLLRALRSRRFQTVVLPAPPGLRSPYASLFVFFAFLVKADRRVLMDPSGGVRPFVLRNLWASVTDIGLFCLGLPMARLATTVALLCARRFPEREARRSGHNDRALAFLVPVLPDISHTFIYRELLSLLAQFGRERKIVVVALEEGDYYPLHDEAKELLAHTVFVPSYSLVRYLTVYLYYLLSRPRRMARLIDAYGPHADGDPWLFLRLENLHGLHPARGIALAHLLEKEGVGYIHCYGTSYPATRALVAARLLDIPFSFSTYVDFDYDYAFKCLAEKLEAAEFVVACTEFCKRRLLELGGERLGSRIHVIYHGIGLHGTYGDTPARTAQPDLSPAIFIACRLVEKKGLDYLVEACAILRERGVASRCLIIGEGPERQRLEGLAVQLGLGDQVQFRGALPNAEIWTQVGSQDICVVPSVYCSDGERDGIPVILLEALARGHAVVSTPVSGIPELIASGVHGVLVPERDTEALADAIEGLLKDGELRERLATAGRHRVREAFAIRAKAAQLWELLQQSGAGADTGQERTSAIGSAQEPRKSASVSVILVNYNGARFIPRLCESLARQTWPPSEVWFFDNNSTDGSADLARDLLPTINVVQYDRNTGYSFPVNEGIRHSQADYKLVLNVDLVLEDSFIEEMVGALERFPTAGWAAGKMLKLTEAGKSEDIDCLGHHMSRMRYATETDHSRPFDWRHYDSERFVFGASACAALYRSSMLEDLRCDGEYFDEDFFAYFEDVDLDWRAQLRGWKCLYVPRAVGYHMRGGSGLIKRADIAACYLANRWLMLVKDDTARHFGQDLVPFATRLVQDVGVYLTTQPLAVWLAVKRGLKLLPRMLAKRRTIQKRSVVARAYIRSLIR